MLRVAKCFLIGRGGGWENPSLQHTEVPKVEGLRRSARVPTPKRNCLGFRV